MNDPSAAFEGVTWMAVLLGVIVVATVILAWARRRLMSSRSAPGTPFSLADLRRLRDRGELTKNEYEAVRRSMLTGALPGQK
ncbi:MAG: SHOCT domain-containing protein [Phycisphaerae bacterium]